MKLLRPIAAVVLVLALIAAGTGSLEFYLQQTNIDCAHEEQKSAAQKEHSEINSSLKQLVPSDYRDKYPAEAKDSRYECLIAKYTNELAVFTKVLAYATVILGLATLGLLVAAFTQSWLARDEFNATHRPWVHADGFKPEGRIRRSKDGDYVIPVIVFLKNTGRTPAFYVHTIAKAKIIAVGSRFDSVLGDQKSIFEKNSVSTQGNAIFPGQLQAFSLYPVISQSDWKEGAVLIYGCIIYRFLDGTCHHTDFGIVGGGALGTGIELLPSDPTSVDFHLMGSSEGTLSSAD